MESKESLSSHERFKAAFEGLGLSQEAVGEILGVSQRTVSNYLNEKTEPSEKYVLILENYDVSDAQKTSPMRIRQLEGLLWKIGSEHPRSREIIQQMLELKDKIKQLLD